MRKILFTICGRAGSKGFKSKNIQELAGKPLVYNTVAAIRLYIDAHPEDEVKIAINTDSDDLKKQIETQNIVNELDFVEREASLADDIVPKVEVVKATYLAEKKKYGCFDHVIDLDITSPIRRLRDIEAAISEMESHAEYDLVFSVVESRRNPYFNMIEQKADGSYGKVCESSFTARQQAPKCYDMNASIYDYRPSFLQRNIDKTIISYNFGIVQMQDYRVLDIDSEEDLNELEFLLDYIKGREAEIDRLLNLTGTSE